MPRTMAQCCSAGGAHLSCGRRGRRLGASPLLAAPVAKEHHVDNEGQSGGRRQEHGAEAHPRHRPLDAQLLEQLLESSVFACTLRWVTGRVTGPVPELLCLKLLLLGAGRRARHVRAMYPQSAAHRGASKLAGVEQLAGNGHLQEKQAPHSLSLLQQQPSHQRSCERITSRASSPARRQGVLHWR